MSTRLEDLSARLKSPLLVTNLVNIRYLTGFDSSNAALLVRPGGETTLYTDFRYVETAREVPGVQVEMAKRALLVDLGPRLTGTVQFEADVLPYVQWEHLSTGKAKLVPTTGVVDELRAVKDEDEVAKIGRAAKIADRGLEALTAETWVGRSERELAWRLRELLHAHGADELAFDSIVASGPNGAMPHAHPTDRIVEANTLVTVDWGVRVDGYCSDCTRTFATGSVTGELARAYDVCLAAQRRACDSIRAGMTGVDADMLARDPIQDAGFGKAFGHGLGHGVGLDVHEAPRLSRESSDTLVADNVVTVEPGIYLEGLGGIRIKDLVVVTDGEPEILTTSTKDLVEVG